MANSGNSVKNFSICRGASSVTKVEAYELESLPSTVIRRNKNLFQASSTPLIAGLMKCSMKEKSTKSHNSSIDTAIEELPDECDDGKGKFQRDTTFFHVWLPNSFKFVENAYLFITHLCHTFRIIDF